LERSWRLPSTYLLLSLSQVYQRFWTGSKTHKESIWKGGVLVDFWWFLMDEMKLEKECKVSRVSGHRACLARLQSRTPDQSWVELAKHPDSRTLWSNSNSGALV
jgi:hypothetical protein